MSITNLKEKLKTKKDQFVNFVIDHQLEVVQTTGAIISLGAFIVSRRIKNNKKDDDDKIVYNIENYYEIDKYYENEKTED